MKEKNIKLISSTDCQQVRNYSDGRYQRKLKAARQAARTYQMLKKQYPKATNRQVMDNVAAQMEVSYSCIRDYLTDTGVIGNQKPTITL